MDLAFVISGSVALVPALGFLYWAYSIKDYKADNEAKSNEYGGFHPLWIWFRYKATFIFWFGLIIGIFGVAMIIVGSGGTF